MVHFNPRAAKQGRGAMSNQDGRFERHSHEETDDGWDLTPRGGAPDLMDRADRTEVAADAAKTVIARNSSPDIPFDQSINPYRGCEHGCVYCFARPSHAYLGLSPGLDFETKIFAKFDAPELLTRELAAKSYRCRTLQLGANTDPYQPIERRLKVTRRVLELLAETSHPVSITTKSDLVCRDLDLLAPMAAKGLAAVAVSVTTLDPALARRMEPRAPTPKKRLEAVRRLSDAGVPVAVLAAPMIPALNDQELEAILAAARDAGARAAGYILLRLPHELGDLFTEWLETHCPDRKDRVLNQMRESRAGALYRAEWGKRQRGTGVQADLLARRFQMACRKFQLDFAASGSRPLRTDLFTPPVPPGGQLALFR